MPIKLGTIEYLKSLKLIPKNNLVGYWPLDGYAYDRSGNANHGTVYGALPVPSQNPAIPASLAYKFDGVDDGIMIPHNSSIDITGNKLTLYGWSKFTTPGYRQIIAMSSGALTTDRKYGLFFSYVSSAIGVGFEVRTTSTVEIQQAYPLSSNTWYFIVGVYDGARLKLYVNSKLIATATQTGNIRQLTQPLYIGNFFNGYSFHDGSIQEVAIFNDGISEQTIKAIYNRSKWKYLAKNLFSSATATLEKTIQAIGRIKVILAKSITSKSRIKTAGVIKAATAKGRVKTINVSRSVISKAKIESGQTKIIQAKANIKQLGVTKTTTAKADIKQLNISKSATAKARVKTISDKTATAKSRIQQIGISKNITAKSNLMKEGNEKTITSKAAIKFGKEKNIIAKGRIKIIGVVNSLTAKAKIWGFPAGYVTMDRKQPRVLNRSTYPKILNDNRKI